MQLGTPLLTAHQPRDFMTMFQDAIKTALPQSDPD